MIELGGQVLAELRRTLRGWDCEAGDGQVVFRLAGRNPFAPPRRTPSWRHLLDALTSACADQGIPRNDPLPLQGLGDADLTFSAVQALDPYLKRRQPMTYRSGFLPQPVVRFTGDRNANGELLQGFATSFVNVSLVQPVASIGEHAALIDMWVSVLSRLGFHAQHLTISGRLSTWRRPPVEGVTLRIKHEHVPLGDLVLLVNDHDPTFMATDIGTGLERLRWSLSRCTWHDTVFGPWTSAADPSVLDAIRTATLIVGSGIVPSSRGAGGSVRRLLRSGVPDSGALGLSRIVRWAHEYWSTVQPLRVPWPEVCRIIEDEMAAHAG